MVGLVSMLLGSKIKGESRSTDRDPADDFWWDNISRASALARSGVYVSPDAAMRLTAVYACVRLLADSVAMLPLKIVRERADGDVERLPNHPFARAMKRPNPYQNQFQFKQTLMGHLALRGNFFGEIKPGEFGPVSEIWPIHPDRVQVERLDNGRIRYRINDPNGGMRVLVQDEMFHLRAISLADDGICGIDPILAMRDVIGKGLAANDYGSRFFNNDARPSGILKHPEGFKDDESRENFKRAWRETFGGSGVHGTAVLEYGIEFQQVALNNEQAQFLETIKATSVEIAQAFRVPPHKIGNLDKATFSNIEQQSLEFVTDSLMPWLTNIEIAVESDLLFKEDERARFTVNALLRGALKDRFAAYAVGRQWGWMSVNDIRRLEDMNGIGPEGDVYLTPLNMTPSDQLDESKDVANVEREPASDEEQPPGKPNGTGTIFLPDGRRFLA